VQKCDAINGVIVGKVLPRNLRLLVIARREPECTLAGPIIGEFRQGRRRRNLDDARFRIDFAGRNGSPETEMPRDEDDAFPDQLIGNRNRLVRIATIVGNFQNQRFPVDAPRCIDVSDRQLGTGSHLKPEIAELPLHRTGDGDRNVGMRCCGHNGAGNKHSAGRNLAIGHPVLQSFAKTFNHPYRRSARISMRRPQKRHERRVPQQRGLLPLFPRHGMSVCLNSRHEPERR